MSEPAAGRFINIYCDESRQNADRYMVLGGLITLRDNEDAFHNAMQLYRQSNNMFAELKWTKVSNQKIKEYTALMDLYFSVSRSFHFKSIVIDTQEIDHKRFNKSDPELGFYKLMYQFLLNSFGAYLISSDQCIIHLDQRTTSKYKLSTLCAILNNGLNKKYGLENKPVRNVQGLNSKDNDFIQVADILMGAIGYEMNGAHTRTNAKQAKISLAETIASKAGLINLQQPTPRNSKHFSIWHFHFRNSAKK